jgi:hypothetical protein
MWWICPATSNRTGSNDVRQRVLTITVGKAQDTQPRRIEVGGSRCGRQLGQGDGQRPEQQTTRPEGHRP